MAAARATMVRLLHRMREVRDSWGWRCRKIWFSFASHRRFPPTANISASGATRWWLQKMVDGDWANGRTNWRWQPDRPFKRFKSFKTFKMFEEITTDSAENMK